MIKKIFGLTIFLPIAFAAFSQKKDTVFLDKILNDFSRNSYFVVVNIASPSQRAPYLIQNNDLFFYFHHTKGFTTEEYKRNVISLFGKDQFLKLDRDADIKKYGFVKIIPDVLINKFVKKGKNAFLERYFKSRMLKSGVTDDKKYFIVKVLYDWHIPSKIDDESGYLIY